MNKKISVTFRSGEVKEFDVGVTLYEISKSFSQYYNYPILIGTVDNDLVELSEKINRSCTVDFYDRSSEVGNQIYSRTTQFLLILAVKELFGDAAEVVIEHSIDKGYYCEINGVEIDKPVVRNIEEKMHELANENLLIEKISVSRLDAIKFFERKKQMDKVKVLKYISNTYINLYHTKNLYDYFYGKLAHTTGQINEFKLTYIKDNGFVLSHPTSYNPEFTFDYVHHQRLFDKFLDYTTWGRQIGISNASDLNSKISKGEAGNVIRLAEAYYNNQLAFISEEIAQNKNIKLVLIAGPSSAGKTTSCKKLAVNLESKGLKPHQISLDDYFYDRDKTPRLENGKLDTESLNAIDITLFNKQLMQLLNGERVEVPTYNFILGKREYNGRYLQIGKDDIILIEGLHCLNEDLTMAIDRNLKYKIYISPLTQLNIDKHNRIHTSDTRKLRRIVRDNKYRGYGASQTLNMWEDIRDGEEKYIFPYQDDADAMLNSALVYEIGVLKTYAEPLLFNVDEDDPIYPEALRLINFLRNFLPIPSEEVPNDSVLREFIGNSCFYKN
ncbi:MAG: nucleoside kinase [Firmicutes bacterium]|nr:nucleoside kinase [Bacillota bacterium]